MRWLLAIVALVLAVPATAQNELQFDRRNGFTHERTGITLPGEIDGARMTRMTDFGSEQYDVSGLYVGRGQDTMISIYIYRAGLPDISVNFDVVLSAISMREGFSPAQKAQLTPQAFTPRGHANADALRLTWPVAEGGDFNTGGVALIPHGEWIIKVRISSNAHDPAALHDFIDEAVAALNLPAPAALAPDAAMILACTDALETGSAHLVEGGLTDALPFALAMDIDASPVTDESGNLVLLDHPVWCRDDNFADQLIYRPDGRRDSYAILISDAGNVLSVGGYSGLASALAAENAPHVAAVFSDANVSAVLGLFDALPAPGEVIGQLRGHGALVTSDRDGNVTVNAGA